MCNWLQRMCNRKFKRESVPVDWQNGVIVPLYKVKSKKGECKICRGTSLVSLVGMCMEEF